MSITSGSQRGGVGKEDQREKLAAVELLKQVLFTCIYSSLYNNLVWFLGEQEGLCCPCSSLLGVPAGTPRGTWPSGPS